MPTGNRWPGSSRSTENDFAFRAAFLTATRVAPTRTFRFVGTDASSSGIVVRDESSCSVVPSLDTDGATPGSTRSERRIVGSDESDGSDRRTAGTGPADGSSRTVLVEICRGVSEFEDARVIALELRFGCGAPKPPSRLVRVSPRFERLGRLEGQKNAFRIGGIRRWRTQGSIERVIELRQVMNSRVDALRSQCGSRRAVGPGGCPSKKSARERPGACNPLTRQTFSLAAPTFWKGSVSQPRRPAGEQLRWSAYLPTGQTVCRQIFYMILRLRNPAPRRRRLGSRARRPSLASDAMKSDVWGARLMPAKTEVAKTRVMPAPISEGTEIAGRYRILSLVGEGGMGAVYRAEHMQLRKVFALKVLQAHNVVRPDIAARFEREAVAAGRIEHPNVVPATDFGKLPDGSFFLVLEFVNGRSLRDELNAGAMRPSRALGIMRGVIAGVRAAHEKGVVHRDLKPENIMLVDRDDNRDFVKLLDFGIARVDSANDGGPKLTAVGAMLGTPQYMSPEQILGHAIDARTDLYSLGVIFFELLTGRCPFDGNFATLLEQHVNLAPPELPPALAAEAPRVAEILHVLLSKDPEKRFQTAKELATAIEEASQLAASFACGVASERSRKRRRSRNPRGHAPSARCAERRFVGRL